MSARRVDVGFWDSPLDQADEQPIVCLGKPAANFAASKQIRKNLLETHAFYLDSKPRLGYFSEPESIMHASMRAYKDRNYRIRISMILTI